jgi:curved DNA-binding protein CbpA
LKSYYDILGVHSQATAQEIRKAFRIKAKELHPDVNPSDSARIQFIEVQQAYEFLTDEAQRRNYDALNNEARISREELEKRERIYKLWVEHQQRQATRRTAMEAYHLSDERNPFAVKFWRGINLFYNIIFLIIFAFIVIAPWYNYYNELARDPEKRRHVIYFIMPSVMGCIFLCWGYYYWFIVKEEHEH